MSTLKSALTNPFVVFGVAVVAFAGWVATSTTSQPATTAQAATRRVLPAPPAAPDSSLEARLGSLKPGVPRLTVEQQLQELPAPDVEPVDVSRGKPVFRSRYRINLDRPVLNLAPAPGEFVTGAYILTVEFDGGTPGHPLTRATLTR